MAIVVTNILNRPNFTDIPLGKMDKTRFDLAYQHNGNLKAGGNSWIVDEGGRRCIRHGYEIGKFGADTGMNDWRRIANSPGLQEVWFGFDFKWDPGFIYPDAGKFFGVTVGGFSTTEGKFGGGGTGPASNMRTQNLGGSVRLRPIKNGKCGLYLYDHLMTGKYGRAGNSGEFAAGMMDGNWHKFAVRHVMNNPLSSNNGLIQIWYDNILVATCTGIAWSRDYITAKGFMHFAINTFIGGSTAAFASAITQYMYQSSIYIWYTNNEKGNGLFTGNDIIPSPMGDLGLVGTPPVVVAPAGTPAVTSIVPQKNSALVSFTYGVSDADSFEFRVNEGTVFPVLNNPINLVGLSYSTSYSIEVRAKNSAGVGSWSNISQFTTKENDSIPVEVGGNPLSVASRGIAETIIV